ncbi:hypothetical protein [Flavobacterium sp. HNIBRBA15423]|uniref:hypothetical protein n=1 Tax=Flavobacterium sp. HNIBRBA15423 TaxID=3458683 RepID=UPI004044D090
MKKSKIKIILSIVIFFCIVVIWFGINFAPGSYNNIIKYEFNCSEDELISKINKLREIEPNLKIPKSYNLIEGRKNDKDYWYHFYVFYKEDQEILNCWLRSNSVTSTSLALVSIRNKYGEWKLLDKDFNSSEKEIEKKEFERRFINKLRKQ